jgi:hypothetical protein
LGKKLNNAMAKLISNTLKLTVSKMIANNSSESDILTEELVAQIEAIVAELLSDKDQVLIESELE